MYCLRNTTKGVTLQFDDDDDDDFDDDDDDDDCGHHRYRIYRTISFTDLYV